MLPGDKELSAKEITRFLSAFVSGRLKEVDVGVTEHRPVHTTRHTVYKHMPSVQEIGYDEFADFALKEGKDAMVCFLDSENDPNDQQQLDDFARNFNRVAERFHDIGIANVQLAVYDVAYNPQHPALPPIATPSLYFFPAYTKRPPFRVFTKNPKALPLMKYI